jgi:hypothetical protein
MLAVIISDENIRAAYIQIDKSEIDIIHDLTEIPIKLDRNVPVTLVGALNYWLGNMGNRSRR